MFRKSLLLAGTMATLMTAVGPGAAFAQGQTRTADRQGYCRTPAPLPRLGREVEQNVKDQSTVTTRRTGGVMAPPPPSEELGSPAADIVVSGSVVPPPPPPPPPSPPLPSAVPSSAAADVVVTGSAMRAESGESVRSDAATAADSGGSASMPRVPGPRPQPRPQAGLLTAGTHDDLLNAQLYARYVSQSRLGQSIPDLPHLDTENVLRVTVNDANGTPIPFANVTVTCSDGNSIPLATQADGTVVLFPELDRLSRSITVRASYNGRPVGEDRRLTLSSSAGSTAVEFTAQRAVSAAARSLDIAFVIDTTGSMGDEISYLQAELRNIIDRVRATHPGVDLRVGFVFYRDTGDDYVTRTVALSRDISTQQGVLAQQRADGGGDYPEAMDQAMARALTLDWRPAAAKTLILVADAPPHDNRFAGTWQAAEVARQQRIHITPVAASGVADKAEYAMRAMAALTQSQYLFLTDDSGIGNPHAPPAIDCYLVTRLADALSRTISSQLSGRRVEPRDQEIIRTVGSYDAGRCILPADFNKDQS